MMYLIRERHTIIRLSIFQAAGKVGRAAVALQLLLLGFRREIPGRGRLPHAERLVGREDALGGPFLDRVDLGPHGMVRAEERGKLVPEVLIVRFVAVPFAVALVGAL